ncbi:MAG: hypothetical protein ABIC40_00895 [bacterium]
MRKILLIGIVFAFLLISSCGGGGSSGIIKGHVQDGFGNPLGGAAVKITLSDYSTVTCPDQWGNFESIAPVGEHTLTISFSNPKAGFKFELSDTIKVVKGTINLGSYTLRSTENMEAWAEYKLKHYDNAIAKFEEQALMARSGQIYLPFVHGAQGEPNENTLLTQGILAAENGLGWCYARGLTDIAAGEAHFLNAMGNGYTNYDALVGLAGVAIGKGQAQKAYDDLVKVIDLAGLYDSSQFHDNIREIDLIALKSLAEFMLNKDTMSIDTENSIKARIPTEGNKGSVELIAALDSLR